MQGSVALNSAIRRQRSIRVRRCGTISSSWPQRLAVDNGGNSTITSEGQTSQVAYQLFLRRERMSDNSNHQDAKTPEKLQAEPKRC